MRRWFVLFICVCFPGSGLFGRGISVENGAPVVTVVVHNWVLPDATRHDPMSRANLAVVRAFQERYPEIVRERYAARYRADPARYGDYDWDRITVRPRKFTGIRVEGVESDLMAIAGGVAPDVMYLNFRRSDTYIRQGFLAPLDEYLADMPEEELNERVHEMVWPVIRRPGPDGTEHTWALPYGGLLGKGLLYRKDRFAEAGLAPPDATWTWEDLHHAVRVLSDPGAGRYGIRFARGTHESYQFTSFLWSAGAEFMVRNPETNEWTIEFDSREAAVALDFYTRLVTEPWVDEGGTQRRGFAFRDTAGAWARWQQGDIAITQGYVDEEMFDVINPELTGLAPIPKGPDGFRASEVNSRMLALFRDIPNPVVRDAAWEFIRFFDSEEAQEIRTRILVESGLAGFLNPRQLERFGYGALLKLTPPGWMDVFQLSIENGRPEPYGPNSNIAYDLLSIPLQRAQQLAIDGRLP
jgi:ABC-type glycerol-3-phosphate transport system substrate-binding protein